MIIPSRLRALLGKRTEPLNTIYLNPRALTANYEYLQGLHPTDALFPVIKSNAYGHGIAEIATILNYIPATYLCVDSYPEYKIAAKHATNHQFLVMSDTNPHNYTLYNRKKSVFVVSSFTTLNFFVQKGRDVRIHLFVNTGMNREGFDMIDMQELTTILRAAPHITVEGLMSHLSHSDDPDMTRTHKQVDRFKEFHTRLTDAGFSPRYRHI
ncbi:MAG: alanine racemase [bacterium]